MDIDLKLIVNLILLNVSAAEDQDPGEHNPEPTPSWSIERAGSGMWKILRHISTHYDGPEVVGHISMHGEAFTVGLESDAHYTLSHMSHDFEAQWKGLEAREMLQVVLGFLQDVDWPKRLRGDEEPERVVSGLATFMIKERPEQVSRERWVAEMNEITCLVSGYDGPADDWQRTVASRISPYDTEEVDDLLGAFDWEVTFGERAASLMEERWRHGVDWDGGESDLPATAGEDQTSEVTLGELADADDLKF